MLLGSLSLVKNLHLRTAIVFSAGRQLNISKQSFHLQLLAILYQIV